MYWQQEQFNVSGSGSHTLKWRYIKDSEDEAGDDRGSVDWLQWSGSPPPDPTNWDTITYTYDPAGDSTSKSVDPACPVPDGAPDGQVFTTTVPNAGATLGMITRPRTPATPFHI